MDHPHHVSSVLQATAVPSNLGLTTIPGTHTNPNPAEFVSMFAGTKINNCFKELGINNVNISNPTYIPIDDSFETIMKSHNQLITSVGLEMSEEDQNLPYLYWTPKLHKSPYKHRLIAGSSK